jgi:hypothetical protein
MVPVERTSCFQNTAGSVAIWDMNRATGLTKTDLVNPGPTWQV